MFETPHMIVPRQSDISWPDKLCQWQQYDRHSRKFLPAVFAGDYTERLLEGLDGQTSQQQRGKQGFEHGLSVGTLAASHLPSFSRRVKSSPLQV
jgi:hypothetical protein